MTRHNQTFTGIVIGGPLDGQLLVHEGGTTCTCVISNDVTRYDWTTLWISSQGEDLNVWVPRGTSRLETLKRLLENYRP